MRKYGILMILVTFITDQLVKYGIVHYWMHPPVMKAICPGFNIVLAWNTGVGFSLFSSAETQRMWALIALTSAIACMVFAWMWREKRAVTHLCLAMITGGALGNIVDRLQYGAVIDFLQLHIGPYYWPAFNVADAVICSAAAVMLLDGLICRRKNG